jgi:putative polyhydroxyalkanoate system protein
MADIKLSREHGHGKAAARERCERLVDKMKDNLGLKVEWDGDTCKFSGPAKGTLVVGEKTVDIEVNLGFAAKIMKGKIEEKVNEGLNRALA